MITDRNKLNFVTIQWLWFLCFILIAFGSSNVNIRLQYAEATQTQTQQQQQQSEPQQQLQPQQEQLKSTLQQQQQQQEFESNGPLLQQQQQHQQDVTVRNFSPRMDYNNNEWRPVGRGDPLKNDPTFDYSPPTLDRVRYWAEADKDKDKNEEVPTALIDAKLKKANPGKNEILVLGVTGDRMRGGAQMHQAHAPSMLKNAKGETPLLQPKYTSIRRSYYAHQLPTHLMPPPMQPMMPATQQQSSPMQQSASMQSPQHSQQHQVHTMHMVKPAHSEYRHNMPGHSYMTSSPMSSMSVHSKPYYMSSSSSTQPWMHHTSSSPLMGTSSSSSSGSAHSSLIMSGNSHRYSHHSHSHAHDSHHQESVNYATYHSRPSLTSTPSIMLGMNIGSGSSNMGHHEIYSPNSIRGSSSHKTSSSSSRKPWIHDLLKKEFIKPVKPTQSPNTYHVETIKSAHVEPQHFEPVMRPQGISTTYAPVTFVTPTMPSTTSTTKTVYITTTTPKQTTTSTSPSPMYSSTAPTHTTHAPRTTTTLSPTRLLIPNTSNLAYRPTVAPVKMTTDSLFKHYNQPEKPLRGPMYLIIEGHSKVKTYGKDELDPHKPKIVPVIPKREPVVRMADPNEQRGTPETFQVKHLHTKTTTPLETSTPAMKTTSSKPTTAKPTTTKPTNAKPTTSKPTAAKATTPKPAVTKATAPNTKTAPAPMKTTAKPSITTTTVKPKTTAKVTTTSKPTAKKTITNSTTSTTVKPATTKAAPKLSVSTTTTTTTTTTTSKPKIDKTVQKKTETTDLKMSPKITNPNALDTTGKKPSQALTNEPPTGMQGLLSFLDSSLDSLFKEDPIPANDLKNEKPLEVKDSTTKLKPIAMKTSTSQEKIEARVSTKLEPIKADEYDDYIDDNYFQMTTEYIPRETRQVFDYDQLPESRINLKDDANFGSFLEQIDDEDDLSAFNLDDEYEEDDEEVVESQQGQTQKPANSNTSNTKHNLTKRIDSLVSGSLEDDFDDFSSLVDDDLTDIEEDDLTDLARNQARQQTVKKA